MLAEDKLCQLLQPHHTAPDLPEPSGRPASVVVTSLRQQGGSSIVIDVRVGQFYLLGVSFVSTYSDGCLVQV